MIDSFVDCIQQHYSIIHIYTNQLINIMALKLLITRRQYAIGMAIGLTSAVVGANLVHRMYSPDLVRAYTTSHHIMARTFAVLSMQTNERMDRNE
jgi:hypothetical protein